MTRSLSRRGRRCVLLMFVVHALLVLACQPQLEAPAAHEPRWACPSPTPIPTRIKRRVPRPTTTPGTDPGSTTEYYEPWEQEYGLPPRTPTPYGVEGNTHYLGQRVEVAPLHVTVRARSEAAISGGQLHVISIAWHNPTDEAIPIDYWTQVRIRSIRQPNGAQISDTWGITDASVRHSGGARPPTAIVPGNSSVDVPIVAPRGTVAIAEIAFRRGGVVTTPTVGTPSSPATPFVTTATPNADLRAADDAALVVQWQSGSPRVPCGDAGALTDWGDGPAPAPAVPAPAGTARVIQIALQQVGKPYIWGAKGPNAFDCSGLTEWSYAQIGINIPTGTSGQWPGLPPVGAEAARSGDLIFFDTMGGGRVTHVGLISDLDNDGDWDMVHAASPQYGVRVDYDVFTRPYYRDRFLGLRTVR